MGQEDYCKVPTRSWRESLTMRVDDGGGSLERVCFLDVARLGRGWAARLRHLAVLCLGRGSRPTLLGRKASLLLHLKCMQISEVREGFDTMTVFADLRIVYRCSPVARLCELVMLACSQIRTCAGEVWPEGSMMTPWQPCLPACTPRGAIGRRLL